MHKMAKSYFVAEVPSLVVKLLLLTVLMATITTTGAQIGVCYGTVANNLPPPREVISMCNQRNIKRMRLYGPNHDVLEALRGSNIELMIGVENERIRDIALNQASADDWVQRNVLTYGNVNFKYIAVGNEIESGPIAQYVGPAIEKIQNAIYRAGFGDRIKVSTAVHPVILQDSYPPSRGSFRQDYRAFLDPIIGILLGNKSPLLLNMYPYFSYIQNRANIDLRYALFTYPSVRVQDGEYGYQNLFDAILDAHYAALEKVGGGSLKIVVSETGWPSAGGDGQVTTQENARIYNSNVIRHVKGGTPRRPGGPIETYLFAMFNENLKHGDPTENNFGLFYPNKSPVYSTNFN
ncbi:glucan endo-1,3-beta-glucosidase, acidic-like [Argentina anserina]|uniref:glucan endo-1,3-beta-glucosidase, acidic-like n=1 Tax=Argentina anserina TaxID=57926 RepID=UPI0021767C7B|nr:glucan endo-1,3-beta-glucosidase, acidic-like [Potentilla anserina]